MDTMTEYGIKADYKHDYSESGKYQPRHLATFAERGNANGVIAVQDPFWVVSGPTGDAATDGFVKIGIADGTGSWPDIGAATYIKLENGKVTSRGNLDFGAFYADMAQIGAPANPASNVRRLFVDSGTGKLSVRTSAGATVSLEESGGGGGTVGGTGTAGTITKWATGGADIEDSIITESGTAITVGGSLTVNTIVAGVADYDKFLVSHAGLIKFRTGTEAYSDMDGYVTADFTTDFAAESLANLATRTHASLSDAPTDAHHNEAHVLATTGPHTGTLPWTDLNKTGSSLGDLATRTHSNLSDAPTSAHHVRYADSEAEAVITAELVDGQSIDNAIDALINTHNVANRHIDHSGVSVTAGTGLSGGGTIAATRTINCDITQYTNALAVAAVVAQNPLSLTNSIKLGGNNVLDSGGNIVFSSNGAGYIDYLGSQGTPTDNDVLAWDNATSKWIVQAQTGGGGPGTGTQWKLPVWNTTTTLGDSMISQNSGGTLATVGGALTASGSFKAGADGFDVDATGKVTDITVVAATVDTDKFIVQDGSQLKYRTGTQVLSDITAQNENQYEYLLSAPVRRDGVAPMTDLRANNGYFFVVGTGWKYWGFPLHLREGKIDELVVRVYGLANDVGCYAAFYYYDDAGGGQVGGAYNDSIGQASTWVSLVFTADHIVPAGTSTRAYWLILKTMGDDGENFRVQSMRVKYKS